MKKIISILLLLSVLSSCNDVLEEVPKDRLSEENFFLNEDDARSAVYAIYSVLRRPNLYGGLYLTHIVVSADYINGRGSYAPISNYQGLDNTNIGRSDSFWDEFYLLINRANSVIKNVADIDMDATLKSQLIAEAHCLRAFSYFHLVRGWGAVPLRLDATVSIGALGAVRAPVGAVYEQIISDLEIAERDLPETAEQSGRVTKWTAKTILADVHLTLGEFDLARSKAEEVIESGRYSLVPVHDVDDFDNLYGPDVITNSEEIFSIHYTNLLGTRWPVYTNHPNAGYSSGGYRAVLGIPASSVIANWSDNDLRKEWSTYTQYINVNNGQLVNLAGTDEPMLFRKFRDANAPDPLGHANNVPLYRYAEVLLMYAEAANMVENGPSENALEMANKVRRRGYGLDINTPSAYDIPAGLSKDDFRDTILIERAHEFIMEGKRWYDLLRTGTAKEAVEAVEGKSFSDAAFLNPIPLNEINNNPELTNADQNPGY